MIREAAEKAKLPGGKVEKRGIVEIGK